MASTLVRKDEFMRKIVLLTAAVGAIALSACSAAAPDDSEMEPLAEEALTGSEAMAEEAEGDVDAAVDAAAAAAEQSADAAAAATADDHAAAAAQAAADVEAAMQAE